MCEYEGTRRLMYGDNMCFIAACPNCGRFVKADDSVTINGLEELVSKPNADCKKCGRVEMPFEGWL